MAPTLDSASSKDLSEFPHDGETRISRFGFLINEASLYKISEIEIIEPGDDICMYISMERVGAHDQSELSEFILDKADENASEEEIIKELLRSDLLDESKNTIAGRIALREYSFVEGGNEI
ncbi:hypothetical protein [Kluyvera intermedia]|uniref:hypothetical protein n=1 Tax=Kluyvera intermedia TaxID=61648 RepID=UPI003523EF1F